MLKLITSILASAALLFGCSNQRQEAEIAVHEEGKPTHSIRIVIEGKEDAIIDDPYIGEIQALSKEYEDRRSHYISERENMTPEERKAYGEYRDQTAKRVRELQKARTTFIRNKMQELGGSSFSMEGSDLESAVESASQYLEKSQ